MSRPSVNASHFSLVQAGRLNLVTAAELVDLEGWRVSVSLDKIAGRAGRELLKTRTGNGKD